MSDDDGSARLLTALREAVGDRYVHTDPALTEQHRRDMQPLAPAGRPLAIVRPATTEEVVAVVRACAQAGVPIVPRGAGSGMTAAANAVDGAVTLVTTRMTEIRAIDADDLVAVVQPGVITDQLKQAAAQAGLFYAPDPTSSDWCTIGGNIANGSAGPHGQKYGTTADAVLGLEVVLADGRVLRTGRRTLKGVSGYDLDRLFVGSEGTLGIITEATLRLRRQPAPLRTAMAAFVDATSAVAAITAVRETGWPFALLEVMDRACIGAVEDHLGARVLEDGPRAAAVLFAQSDSGSDVELQAFLDAAEAAGAALVYVADDEAEGEMLMAYWHELEAALEKRGRWIVHEVTVPVRQVGALLDAGQQVAAETGLFVGIHGHAQDGTMHPMIVFDGSEEQAALARRAYERVLEIAVALGGPVTGEHGVGRMKRDALGQALGEVGLDVHRAIKAALDPTALFNPGAMFDYPHAGDAN